MSVPIPLSPAFVSLLLTLPGVWLLGRGIARAVSRDRTARAALGPGLALVLGVLGVHVASLAARSLRVGLPVGLCALAAAGVVAELARRRRPTEAEQGPPPSRWMGLTALVATAAMAPLALGYHIHDELFLTGHMSIAGQLQNGVYPPRHLAFPDTPLRYHYGFDLVSASVGALLHLPIDRAIDVATLALFALSWCLFWALGERLIGRGRAWLVPLLALFGGGLPALCDNAPTPLGRVVELCMVGRHYLNPPLPSYFFQHPWTLGIPVGAAALLVLTDRRAPREAVRLAALAACLAALAFSQITMFAGFVPSFLVAETFCPGGFDLRRGLRALAALTVAVVAAALLGGFFVSAPGMPGLSFVLQTGFGASPDESLSWTAQTSGALLPLGALGLLALRRDRLVFALIAAGSLVVVNAVRFEGSDDIMKFATLGSLSLAVLSAAAIARLLPGRTGGSRISLYSRQLAAASLVGLACITGGTFVAAMGLHLPQIPWYLTLAPQQPAPADAALIAWMREQLRPGELVYRAEPAGWAYAQWGGMPVPWIQWTVRAFGFSDERIAAREDLLRRRPDDPVAWRREGIRFLVLEDTSSADLEILDHADRWIGEGRARRALQIENLVVVELFDLHES